MEKRTAIRIVTSAFFGALVSHFAPAQAAPDILRTTFEDNKPTWISYGKLSHAGITREPIDVKEGSAALQFDYQIEPGSFYGLGKIFKPGQLKNLQSVRFWVKTDETTPFGVLLQERKGGRYVAAFTVPGNTWQRVELAPSDFAFWQNIGATPDPDNHLDLDQVEFIALGDFNQVPAQFEDPTLDDLFHVRVGPHVLYLDDIRLSIEPLGNLTVKPGDVALDSPNRPQIMWLTMGRPKLTRITPESGAGLQLDYKQVANQPQGLIHLLPAGILRGRTKIAFTASSLRATTLTLRLEEASGAKYSASVKVPAGTPQEIQVPFADFHLLEDSHDNNKRLDIEEVFQLSIFEEAPEPAAALLPQNTLQLSNLRAIID